MAQTSVKVKGDDAALQTEDKKCADTKHNAIATKDTSEGVDSKADQDEKRVAQDQTHFSIFCILFMLGFEVHARKYPDELYSWITMAHLVTFISVPRAKSSIYQDVVFLSFCTFCLYTMLKDSPFNANHHNMCGYICMILLPCQIRRICGFGDKHKETANCMNVVRWNIIFMYFIAAFHKINHDFLFEPTVSCAYDMLTNYLYLIAPEMYDSEDEIIVENMPWFLKPLPFLGLFVEIVPPILLCFKSFQKWGVLLLISLHWLLLPIGFSDFGSIAQSFLWLFVSPIAAGALSMQFYTDMAGCFVFFHATVQVMNHLDEEDHNQMRDPEAAIVFLAFGIHWASVLRAGGLRDGIQMRQPKSVFSLAALAFFAFFGMNTYLGLRTTGTLTMFSNLRTEGSYSNHLLLRSNPLKIFGYQEDIVTVLDLDRRFVKDSRLQKHYSYQRINFKREMRKEKRWDVDELYLKVSYKGEIYETDDLNSDPLFDVFREEETWIESKYMDFRDTQPYESQECVW